MNQSILIVDDEDSIRETWKIFLLNDGHKVITAATYQDALDALESEYFSVIITDVVLKADQGLKLLSRAKERFPLTPVVLVTGQPDLDTLAKAWRLGAYDFKLKPLTKDTLLATVRRALEHHRLLIKKQELEQDNERYRLKLEELVEERTRDLTQEIVERKRARAALADSEDRYRSLMNNVTEAVIILDMSRILYCNRRAADLSGYSFEEQSGMSAFHVVHPLDREWMEQAVGNIPENGIRDLEFRILSKSGKTYWMLAALAPVSWSGEKAILACCVDITARKEAEEALKESTAKYRSLVENSSEGITLVGRDGTIRESNTKVSELLGIPKEDLVGKNPRIFLHPDELARRPMRLDLDIGQRVRFHRRAFNRQGLLLHLEVTATGLDSDNILIMSRDISPKVSQAEEQAYEAMRKQVMLNYAKALITTSTPREVAEESLAHARQLTRSPAGLVQRLAPNSGEPDWDHVIGADTLTPEQRTYLAPLLRKTIRDKVPLRINHPGEPSSGLSRLMTVPAVHEDQSLSLLCVYDSTDLYTETDLTALEDMAALMALALNRLG